MSDCPAEVQSLPLGINHSLLLSLKLSRPLEDFYNYDAPGFIIKALIRPILYTKPPFCRILQWWRKRKNPENR